MSLQQDIKEQMKDAMRAKDAVRLSTLRGLISAFTNELVAQKKTPQDALSDSDALAVIKRAVKQRKDSISQFESAGRGELAEGEKAELAVLMEYVPETMSQEDIEKIARAKMDELGVTDKSKMGVLMGALMKELGGKADGGDVKEVVSKLFAE